ncbi:isochorismatase family cysteine hydrolase [Sorangium sp. So ce327]|jgi:biuret amidohydrolase|uniref:cysteine hydrolase family protein n=1 Tax=Sorangium sp. So ce327 TaxID=3133301 RepID=UPI003F63FF75
MTPRIRPLPLDQVRPATTALLVIDMQRDFVEEGAPCEARGALDIVQRVNALAAWARGHGLPVIFSQEMHRADRCDFGIELEFEPPHCLEGSRGAELVDGLRIEPQDHRIFTKRRYDCFLGTDLDLLLRSKRVENLICCGVCTNICVLSTVLTARNLDYRVLLPVDAVAGTTRELHDAAILCMSNAFAYVTESAAVMQLFG